MRKIRLGKTELIASSSGFGALPIQRLDMQTAVRLLRKAYDNGINFFDTANAYSNSEEKIGKALSDVRGNIIIATKSMSTERAGILRHVELSLKRLNTDYVDILQLHTPHSLPDIHDPDGAYAGLLEARRKGYTRFIGITNHSADVARSAVLSGAYDTLQYPFSSLATQAEIELARLTHEKDMGFIAMKGLAGGLIRNAATTFSFIRQYPFVLPIWGIQEDWELLQFIELEKNPPAYDDMKELIEKDRNELAGNFCHACGYCLPCPAEIPIPNAARISLLLRRAPYEPFISEEYQAEMMKIENCIDCGTCRNRCPYGLNTPQLLKENLTYYKAFCEDHKKK